VLAGTGLANWLLINMNANAAMQRPSNRALNVLVATGGLGLLLAGLAIVDERVRLQFAQIVTGQGASGEVGSAVARIQDVAGVVLLALRDQSMAYAPLTIFGLAALVLVLFMTRT
jgi:hypothetical protein